MSKESQALTSLELKNASQKSRISEMEGSLNLAQGSILQNSASAENFLDKFSSSILDKSPPTKIYKF
jgi:uncharacterized coiled-coil protein SlyX